MFELKGKNIIKDLCAKSCVIWTNVFFVFFLFLGMKTVVVLNEIAL